MTRTEQEYNYRLLKQRQVRDNLGYLAHIDYKGSQVSPHFQVDPQVYPSVNVGGKVFYFDIDNTLYLQKFHINVQVQESIIDFMINILHFNDREECRDILEEYCDKYGLSLIGFMKDYNVDPEEYNLLVDDTLQLNNILKPDKQLRHFLLTLKLDYKFDKLWLFTNSFKTHALSCVKLLGIADLFDGITYCDYYNLGDNIENKHSIRCKPNIPIYEQLKLESGLDDWEHAYFVDDNLHNLQTAQQLGMKGCFHLVTPDTNINFNTGKKSKDIITIDHLSDILKNI